MAMPLGSLEPLQQHHAIGIPDIAEIIRNRGQEVVNTAKAELAKNAELILQQVCVFSATTKFIADGLVR